MELAEGAAVPAWLEPDQRVGHGQAAQEQHQQQQHQVEIVRPEVSWQGSLTAQDEQQKRA